MAFLNSLIQVVLLSIALTYWWTQVVHGESYRLQADNNRLRQLSLQAPRGLITDRHGRFIVENVPSYALYVDRSLTRDLGASLGFAAEILGLEPAVLERRIAEERAGYFQPVRIARHLDLEQVSRFGVEQLEHPELEVVAEQLRLNRHGYHTAHLIGYLGRVTKEDLALDETIHRDDQHGRAGIEGRYDDHLRGERGEQIVVVDSRGRRVEELDPKPARPGGELRLTLDLALQQEAARLLKDRAGAVVALDPREGDVLVLYSAPAFDPNAFTRGLSSAAWKTLRNDPGEPLNNRALLPAVPGSVFKIVMALAALDRELVDPEETVFCRGATRIYNRSWRCWHRGGHGRVNLEDSLRDSCDIYYYQLGQQLDIDEIARYAERLGLGRVTGIPMARESAGLMPTRAWKREARGEAWFAGETISVAIGQGQVMTTPLQIAVMMGAVGTGHLVKPRMLLDEPVKRKSLDFRTEHVDRVRRALWKVVNDPKGTGKTARVDAFDVAGKTGTAQVVQQKTWTKNEDLPPELRDHAWFASYAPAEDPELVIVVFVEHGGGGSTTAAPIAKALYEFYAAR